MENTSRSANRHTTGRYYSILADTGPDWYPATIPNQYVQIVAETPPVSYNTLMHDTVPTSSGYFSIPKAYNEVFPKRMPPCGYAFHNRTCDGSLSDSTSIPNTTPPPTFVNDPICQQPPSPQEVVQFAKFKRQCLPIVDTPPNGTKDDKCHISSSQNPCHLQQGQWISRAHQSSCCL